MTKQDVSEIETGAGFFMGFVNATMDVVREKAVPFAAIYRLATSGGRTTLGKIVNLAYADWLAERPKPAPMQEPQGSHPYRGWPTNGSSPFTAPVVYIQPAFEELKRRLLVYDDSDYKGKRFDPIERCNCKDVSTEDREVAFEYVHMDRTVSTDGVFAEMDRKGLRPALYEELLGFAEKYPDEQRKYPIVALGSETYLFGRRRVAYLWGSGHRRELLLHWIDGDWDDHCRFLAVRK